MWLRSGVAVVDGAQKLGNGVEAVPASGASTRVPVLEQRVARQPQCRPSAASSTDGCSGESSLSSASDCVTRSCAAIRSGHRPASRFKRIRALRPRAPRDFFSCCRRGFHCCRSSSTCCSSCGVLLQLAGSLRRFARLGQRLFRAGPAGSAFPDRLDWSRSCSISSRGASSSSCVRSVST